MYHEKPATAIDRSAPGWRARWARFAAGGLPPTPTPYGLRRPSASTDRRRAPRGTAFADAALVPGPDVEVGIVQRIFDLYGVQGARLAEIARILHRDDLATPHARPGWKRTTIRRILLDPVYIGVNRWGVMMREAAHPALVDRAVYFAAQARLIVVEQRRRGRRAATPTAPRSLRQRIARCPGFGHPLRARRQPAPALLARFAAGAYVPRAPYGLALAGYGSHASGGAREPAQLVAGSPDEVAVVRRIFALYATTGLSLSEIAGELMAGGTPAPRGVPVWRISRIASVLTDPVYVGASCLGPLLRVGAHAPLVDEALFYAACARWYATTASRCNQLRPTQGRERHE